MLRKLMQEQCFIYIHALYHSQSAFSQNLYTFGVYRISSLLNILKISEDRNSRNKSMWMDIVLSRTRVYITTHLFKECAFKQQQISIDKCLTFFPITAPCTCFLYRFFLRSIFFSLMYHHIPLPL